MLKEQKHLKTQIQETNNQLKLYEKLFSASALEDFLLLLYKETRSRFKIGALTLCLRSGHFGPFQYVCQTLRVYKKNCSALPVNREGGFRVKDRADSQYLADFLGRPVQNILSIPIYTKRFSVNQPVFFFLEFFAKSPDKLMRFYDESFLLFMTNCIDRLLLNDHLSTGIRLWTSTFNRLSEPLAVFDCDNKLEKANSVFSRIFDSSEKETLNQSPFYWKDKIFEKHIYPVNTKSGEYTVCHYADISESLSLRTRMIQNMKMSALGELGEKVAQELSNPLAGVLSMAEWLLSSGRLRPELKKDMKDIIEGVSRSQKIIVNLRDFAGMAGKLNVCDLNEVVKKTLPFLKSLLCFSDLRVALSKEAVHIKAEAGLLRQVVFNLIKNSFQAVSSLNSSSQEVVVKVYKDADRAFLRVEDSGMGIKPEDYQNVFQPFFTTKSKSQGTGLGLSVSKNIVESFQGSLKAGRSSLGGACFTMSLPLSDKSGI